MRASHCLITCVVMGLAVPVADAWPMHTKLDTIRTEVKTVVIGTVTHPRGGLVINVDTVVLGPGGLGPMQVKDSPDGMVFSKPNVRVLVIVDNSDQLRWMGRLVAGKNIETGVLRLEGFYDYNAHHVTPGLMTLAQLKTFLNTGALKQEFLVTLGFPDGAGGLKPSKQTFTIEFDAIARKVAVRGLTMPCLDHPQLSGMSWGNFSVFFHCRQSTRRLTLSGEYTGVHKSGAIEVMLVPERPFLYAQEFVRFANDAKLVGLERVIHIELAGSATWQWHVGVGLVDPSGKLRKPRGATTSSQASGGKKTSRDVYRFDGASLSLEPSAGSVSPGGHTFSIVQLADSSKLTKCTLTIGSKQARCKLRHRKPVWKTR